MNERVLRSLFSLSGLSLSIGAIGAISAFVGIFIDVNQQVSIRWLLFAAWIAVSFSAVLLKIIYDLTTEKKPAPTFETPFRYIAEDRILLIRTNSNFLNNIVVGIYTKSNEVERLVYIGIVHHVQANLMQIKIHKDMGVLSEAMITVETLNRLEVRSVVPFDAIAG